MDIGILASPELSPEDSSEIQLKWDEKKILEFLQRLNELRLAPNDNLDKTIEIAKRLIITEFSMITKL